MSKRSFISILIIQLLFASCDKLSSYRSFEFEGGRKMSDAMSDRHPFMQNYRDTLAYREMKENEKSSDESTELYAVGVEFPSDYDWQRDSSYGNTRASIVLYKNGERIREFEAGATNGVSVAADRIFLVGKDVYTLSYGPYIQTLQKNGADKVKLGKDEILKDLLVKEDGIYTLCQMGTEGGVSFRKDNVLLFSDEHGMVQGELYEDMGKVCFSYTIAASWFSVSDGSVKMVGTSIDRSEIMDVRSIRGEIFCAIKMNGGTACAIEHAGVREAVTLRKDSMVENCMLGEESGEVVAVLYMRNIGISNYGAYKTWLWREGKTNYLSEGRAYTYLSHGRILTISQNSGNVLEVKLNTNPGEKLSDVYFMSARCAHFDGKNVRIALSSKEKSKHPFVWSNGCIVEYDLNGYLCGINVD